MFAISDEEKTMAEKKKGKILIGYQVMRAEEGITPRNLEKAIKPGVPEGLQPPKAPPKVYPGQTRATLGQPRPAQSGGSDGSADRTERQGSNKE